MQRNAALELANRRRGAKAEVRRKLKAGEVHPGRLLTEPAYAREVLDDDELTMLLRMELRDVLSRCHRMGRIKAEDLLRQVGLDGYVTIGHFVNGHRATLRGELEERAIWRTWQRLEDAPE